MESFTYLRLPSNEILLQNVSHKYFLNVLSQFRNRQKTQQNSLAESEQNKPKEIECEFSVH